LDTSWPKKFPSRILSRKGRAEYKVLAEQGFVTPSGRPYAATAVKGMLGEGGSKSRALKHTDAKGRRLLWAE